MLCTVHNVLKLAVARCKTSRNSPHQPSPITLLQAAKLLAGQPRRCLTRDLVGWIQPESFRLGCPALAEELVWCEAYECLEPTAEIIGFDEAREVFLELVVIVLVIALDGRILDGALHSLNLAVIRHDAPGALMFLLILSGSALW
jgi:hypothetical protein